MKHELNVNIPLPFMDIGNEYIKFYYDDDTKGDKTCKESNR